MYELQISMLFGAPVLLAIFNIWQCFLNISAHNTFLAVGNGLSFIFCIAIFGLLSGIMRER